MTDSLLLTYLPYLPPELRSLPWRTFPLDGKLLLFDRHTGLNVLLEGEETAHFRQIAPRSLLIAVTNACNLNCAFCYRDHTAASLWTADSLLQFCQEADHWGVLEVAFGGGEPLLFPDWAAFITELHDTTQLSVNFTTNGMLLTEDFLRRIAGKYGQIRLSLYEDNHGEQTIDLLVRCGARFGINWMITSAALAHFEHRFAQFLQIGVHDFLLIGYKGSDESLRLNAAERERLAQAINRIYQLPGIQIKLDACWGDSLPDVPRLFHQDDCGAGESILSITSDKRVKPCSFHQIGPRFETLDDVRHFWESHHVQRIPAEIGGCTR